MEIVEPYAKMLSRFSPNMPFSTSDGLEMLKSIEYYARVSHRSEEGITIGSYDRFLRSVVIQHGDWSVTEHEKVTCEFLVDRGLTHEIVRHRIGSYTQESTRFVNYSKPGHGAKFIQPAAFETQEQHDDWWEAVNGAEKSYQALIRRGVKPQIARSVFPNALASKIIVTYNLRSWRHFFIMRTSAQAHPQLRQVVDPLLEDFKRTIPILYEDINPGQQQSEAMRRMR